MLFVSDLDFNSGLLWKPSTQSNVQSTVKLRFNPSTPLGRQQTEQNSTVHQLNPSQLQEHTQTLKAQEPTQPLQDYENTKELSLKSSFNEKKEFMTVTFPISQTITTESALRSKATNDVINALDNTLTEACIYQSFIFVNFCLCFFISEFACLPLFCLSICVPVCLFHSL